MRKIIKGKKYDTDTATLVGEWSPDISVTDFDYFAESMYRKRTGEYFLYGEGGPSSKYAVHSYGSWTGGEAITPLTLEEADGWAQRYLDEGEYEREFGPVDDGGGKSVVGIRLSPEARAKLDKLSYGTTKSEAVERLIMAAE
jgi:hypothetical protein